MTDKQNDVVERVKAFLSAWKKANNERAVQIYGVNDQWLTVDDLEALTNTTPPADQIAENADDLAGECKLLHKLVAAQIEEDGADSSFMIRSGLLYKILSHLQAAPSGDDLTGCADDFLPGTAEDWRKAADALTTPPSNQEAALLREALKSAYVAGATAVHEDWLESHPSGALLDNYPEFVEAASDYATGAIEAHLKALPQ